jgi:hypothetical protein
MTLGRYVFGSVLLGLGIFAAVLAGCGGSDDVKTAGGCSGEVISGISPPGTGSEAFTMLLRINSRADVSDYAGNRLRSKILDRDIFVINTEDRSMTTKEEKRVFDDLKSEFPCNRVAALNGLLEVPGRPGYKFALAEEPGLDSVILDWEKSTWSEARDGPWSERASVNLRRMAREIESVAARIESGPGSPGTRVALATQYRPGWDYAAFAKQLAAVNWKINRDFRGFQVVQSQGRCAGTGRSASLAALAKDLISQYGQLSDGEPGPNGWQQTSGPQVDMRSHLGFEISFSDDPKPGDSLPAGRDSSSDAAGCTADVLAAGATAFIYWAEPEAVQTMLTSDLGKKLRPSGQS